MTSILTIVLGALVVRHVSVSVSCCPSRINYSVCIPWKSMLEDKRLSMSVFILEYTFITEGGEFWFTWPLIAIWATSLIVVCNGYLKHKVSF